MKHPIKNAGRGCVQRSMRIVSCLSLLALASCTSGGAGEAGEQGAARVEGLRSGDTGPEVRFVHDYLYAYGYFPNDALAERVPGFRPMVMESPADPDQFDETLEQGVRAFQSFYRLPATGVVDADTLALMKQPRCSYPDSAGHQDDGDGHKNDKFVLNAATLGEGDCAVKVVGNTREITWRAEETDSTRLSIFQSALSEWTRATSIRWRKVTSGGCVVFKKGRPMTTSDRNNPNNASENPLAVTVTTFNNSTKKISHADLTIGTHFINGQPIQFFTSTTVDPNRINMRLTMMHEIGHTFSLGHSTHPAFKGDWSGVDDPVMLATVRNGDDTRLLTDDDLLGAHFKVSATRYLSLERGTWARSMDVARNGDLWEVDGPNGRGSDGALRCNGQTVPGWGVQIAVDFSRAWHVNAAGEVWRNQLVGCPAANWSQVPSDAPLAYIAANGDGIVWGLSKAITRGTQDRDIFVFNGARFVKFWGNGTRIAVDAIGRSYHVNQAGEMYYLDMAKGDCQSNPNAPIFGQFCWVRFGTGTNWGNVHAGKNSFIWLISKNGSMPYVIDTNLTQNGTVGGTPCYPEGGSCKLAWGLRGFLGFASMEDAVSDGDSRVYLHEGFIPTDGGPTLSPGNINMVF